MLYSTKLPDSKENVGGLKAISDASAAENKEIFELMKNQPDEEIIALAKEMEIPLEYSDESKTKLKDKEASIRFLIQGGCPNCGKKKN